MGKNPAQGTGSTVQPYFGPLGGGFGRAQGQGGLALDVDAQTYIDAMSVTPDGARQTVINQVFRDLKGVGNFGTDNIFSQLDALWLLAADTEQASLLDLRRAFDATAVNAPTFEVDRGFTGGATRFINTNFTPSTDGVNYTLDDASASAYTRTDAAANTISLGVRDGTADGLIVQARTAGGVAAGRVNQIDGSITVATANSLGLLVSRRTGAAATQLYKNGSEIATDTDASSALPDIDVYLLGRNSMGSVTDEDTHQTCFASLGAGLSATEQLNLFNAIETYMDAVGAGVVT